VQRSIQDLCGGRYAYQQITADSGQLPVLGPFESHTFGIDPQIGYLFPVGDMQGYLNLKGYGEFGAENRPSGWNTWLTFSISQAPPASTVTPTRHLLVKSGLLRPDVPRLAEETRLDVVETLWRAGRTR
jgi:hypothetical protein